MTPTDVLTLAHLSRRPMTVREIAFALDRNDATIGCTLSRLKAKGFVTIQKRRDRGIGNGRGRGPAVYALVERPKGA